MIYQQYLHEMIHNLCTYIFNFKYMRININLYSLNSKKKKKNNNNLGII